MNNIYCFKHAKEHTYKCPICKSIKGMSAINIMKLGREMDKVSYGPGRLMNEIFEAAKIFYPISYPRD